jgi:hypothetical protein
VSRLNPYTRLTTLLSEPTPAMLQALRDLKAKATVRAASPTFVWDSLVQSFATMGNPRGRQGLVENQTNAGRVAHARVGRVSPDERLEHLDNVLRDAVVRMPAQKARWLVANFDRIVRMGGLTAANNAAFNAPGREAKIAFMCQFDGIGDKYARNIWGDVYHPDFYDAIAVDERIKVTEVLGRTFSQYADHERFYQGLAREVGLQPWELDRLMYHFNQQILSEITR